MLVVPVSHVVDIYRVEGELAGPLMTTLSRVARAVKQAFAADGVSVRQNNEAHGGQDVFHLHFHVVPRFAGDRFNSGGARSVEVPVAERIRQAAAVRDVLNQHR
jgi:histidine triad (HIT) family protein